MGLVAARPVLAYRCTRAYKEEPKQHEEFEQIALFLWAAMQENVYLELRWLHHIPNGGHRHKATATQLKRAGVKSGVPNMCLPVAKGGYHGLYIEMKFGRNKTTDNQVAWIEHLRGAGYAVEVCYGCEEAIREIKDYINK